MSKQTEINGDGVIGVEVAISAPGRRHLRYAARFVVGLVLAVGVVLGLQSAASAAPPNDNFPGTTLVGDGSDGLPAGVVVNIAGSTLEPGEPTGGFVTNGVWYSWTPSVSSSVANAHLRLSNVAGWTPIFDWYTGSSFADLDWRGSNTGTGIDDQVVAGTTYRIRISGLSGPTGSGNLTYGASPPLNDDFYRAEVLPDFRGKLASDNVNATGENLSVPLASVWYRWTPTSSGPVTFSLAGSSFDTTIEAFTGSSLDTLQSVAFNDDTNGVVQSEIKFYATAGTTYQIAISGFRSKTGNFVLQWSQIPPFNDDLNNAVILPGDGGILAFNNLGATREPGEPATHGGCDSDGSVWFRWFPQADGIARIRLSDIHWSWLNATGVAVYTGNTVNALTHVNGDDTDVDFAATAFESYWIAVTGCFGQQGQADLTWGLNGPANDDFSAAQVLAGASSSVSGTNVRSTAEQGEPIPASGTLDSTVWYAWTAPVTGNATLTLANEAGIDGNIDVYTGSGFADLVNVASSGLGNNTVSLPVSAGTRYWIQIDGAGTSSGTFDLGYDIVSSGPLCNGLPATIVGAGIVTGTPGDDVIVGSGGNDTINGLGGNDTICAGEGNDTMTSSTVDGADWYSGEGGIDTVSYQQRSSSVTVSIDGAADDGAAGEGDNVTPDVENVFGSKRDDTISGSAAANVLNGNGGNDTLVGNGGNDKLNGNAGNDTLQGGDGRDVLVGGAGSDQLFGNAGNDTLKTTDGVSGNDSADGGTGNDTAATDPGDVVTNVP